VTSRLVRLPLATSEDAAVTQAVERACRSVLGQAEIGGVAFWTDAALMSAAGIPSVVFGVKGGGMHSTREWVDVSSMRQVAEVLLATAIEVCS
jgi:acetylornithine deacetylase